MKCVGASLKTNLPVKRESSLSPPSAAVMCDFFSIAITDTFYLPLCYNLFHNWCTRWMYFFYKQHNLNLKMREFQVILNYEVVRLICFFQFQRLYLNCVFVGVVIIYCKVYPLVERMNLLLYQTLCTFVWFICVCMLKVNEWKVMWYLFFFFSHTEWCEDKSSWFWCVSYMNLDLLLLLSSISCALTVGLFFFFWKIWQLRHLEMLGGVDVNEACHFIAKPLWLLLMTCVYLLLTPPCVISCSSSVRIASL